MINGKSLKSLVANGNYKFETHEDVKSFFIKVILKDLDPTIDKESVASYLMTSFHQGGLMYPVSGPLAMVSKIITPGSNDENIEKQINIVTTARGFKVQELFTSKKYTVAPDAPDYLHKAADELDQIFPDPGNDYVVKAGGTIDLDFSRHDQNPDMTVEASSISYGNAAVQSVLDIRHFGHKIIDFFKNILGLNSIKDISESDNSDAEATGSDRYRGPGGPTR